MDLNTINHLFDAFPSRKTLSFKQSTCGFAGLDIDARYSLLFGRYLKLLIYRLTNSHSDKIGMTI